MDNTREKLIELLDKARDLAMETCGSMNKGFGAWYADHLIANGVTISNLETVNKEWIPVSERLPEFNQPCLCYKKVHGHPEYRLGTYLGATFSDNCAAFRSMSHFGCIGATHWMPLPEPPKGE